MKLEACSALLAHYDRVQRDLPWRGETDPYRILVKEVMLQQTRVDTVLRYYDPWLRRFPDVETLAVADTDEVLKEWEGLGYYRRARNLHAAAQVVRARGGEFPRSYGALLRLPGVGEYTAGAVASIALQEPVPAVDGNVRRVLARWYDEELPTAAWLREKATALVHVERPGDWNQSLMELGATICTPRAPKCAECPMAKWCAANTAGTQAFRPAPARKARAKPASFLLAVLEADGAVLLTQRPDEGLLAGMWAFPERLLVDAPEDLGDLDALTAEVAATLGAEPVGPGRGLQTVGHRFSHIHARYKPWVVSVRAPVLRDGYSWVRPGQIDGLAVPVAQRKVLRQLEMELA
ncbi:MAG: A/G-specific adenine glycosylase [Proteobacteria bacterium]|nr:A/G-specific adenine glycosylase [Pseudomonadota bacterium]